ncbi:TPA: hypothetical protein N0F65_005177 [Lagenidium giganteum]|uniref:Galactokinase n=1 Tax=Lagenidium giganteum TaxID=4803 RepID=A0AAV2Z0I7_9STRA|nr:TPA: hypothetical protein N0F65_005177 [Lagenidium giganteum]
MGGDSNAFRPIAVNLRCLQQRADDAADASTTSATARIANVAQHFYNQYQRWPTALVRAPGRVNLIGEHIDYEGYGVLPMAITQDVCIAFAPKQADGSEKAGAFAVDLKNAKAAYHENVVTSTDISTPLKWSDYFLCGYKGMIDFREELRSCQFHLDAIVDGTIPPGCGLSSSSAFVVASALVTAFHLASDSLPGRAEVAELCRVSEHYIGTIGGGMDQAASCLSQAGYAQLINFHPLRTLAVKIPADLDVVFVVANSMVVSEKAVDAVTHFNKRVIECALAVKWIAKALQLPSWKELYKFADLQKAYGLQQGRPASLSEMQELARKHLPQDVYTSDELASGIAHPLSSLFEGISIAEAAKRVLEASSEFKLRQRALHVFGEAERVEQFEHVCHVSHSSDDPQATRQHLGRLMHDSHVSCRDLYECSCPDLDALVDAAMRAGAFGARLTGAGWGGCSIAMVRSADVDHFVAQLDERYYRPRGLSAKDAVFVSTPSAGADVYTVVEDRA